MIPELKKNLETEIAMAKELISFVNRLSMASAEERTLVGRVIESLKIRIKILNASNEGLVKNISLTRKLPGREKLLGIEKLQFEKLKQIIAIRAEDKEKYLRELSISEGLLRKLRKKPAEKQTSIEIYKRINLYAQTANKFFLDTSNEFLKKGYFRNLNLDLRKANINILTSTYVSMIFFSTIIAAFIGFFVFLFFLFFTFSFQLPFIGIYDGNYLLRAVKIIWIIIGFPLVTFMSFYFYPVLEGRSLTRRIETELPFVVIHMGSIAGSGIEPSQIFKIVGLSKEYKYSGGEIRKLLNQINVYGYDITTALKNVARLTPSPRFSELLTGLSTTISSGGDLKIFFDKRAESLLLNYRLEREKFSKIAETFMDMYISVVIATPMILLLLLVMISVSGIQTGFGLGQLTFLIISVVILVNIVFLWLLSMRQPAY